MRSKFASRKAVRLRNFDYSTETIYFLTICTYQKRCALSSITTELYIPEPVAGEEYPHLNVGDEFLHVPNGLDECPRFPNDVSFCDVDVILTPIGMIVKNALEYIDTHNPNISLDKYVIMPNHLHMLVAVNQDLGTCRSSSPTESLEKSKAVIPVFVSSLKRFTNKQAGRQIWQRTYYDHIIRNVDDYENHWQYIEDNPIKWETDEYFNF